VTSKRDKEAAAAARGAIREQLTERIRLVEDPAMEILRLLEEADARIAALLAGQPSDAERWLLPQLQASVRQTMTEFGDQAGSRIESATSGIWHAGRNLVDAPLAAGGMQIALAAPFVEGRQLAAMRAFMTDRIKDVGVQAINRINTQLGLVVLGAQPPADAVGSIRKILGEASRARAVDITRTELSRVYSTAALERLTQQAQVVPGLKKQWRKSGKRAPRLTHAIADGQVRDVDQPFKVGAVTMMAPHDPAAPAAEIINCGCTVVPWMAAWAGAMATPGRIADR